ncbi:MAG TPA: DUF58 domain-containing protein [Kofleriaceae bacterium]|nr:DUF58 domain-containing protein [Kofleriaceae bacterium]
MLTAELVQQVRRIQLVTGRQVADVMAGAYLSVFKGRGMEFDEVRPYVPGDDVRTIDWNVTARVGEPYIKRYVEERELTVLLLVDISPSQDFGSASRSKREAAVELAALVAFSAIYNQDKVGLLLFHGAAEEYIPPRKGQKHALRVIREVLARGREESSPLRERRRLRELGREIVGRFRRLVARTRVESRRSTNIAHALEFCRRVLPRRAVLFLVSDFLDDGYLPALITANRRHDVVCVQIEDQRERQLEASGLVMVEDAESGARQLVDTGSSAFRDAMAEANRARDAALARELGGAGIDLIRIDATRPVIEPLLGFFRARERRLRR